jgi:hypothetical protein
MAIRLAYGNNGERVGVSRAAHEALGKPSHVQLCSGVENGRQFVLVRRCEPEDGHSRKLTTGREFSGAGGVARYGIEQGQSLSLECELVDGYLCAEVPS